MDRGVDLQAVTTTGVVADDLNEPAPLVSCAVCQREIPLSAAASREASDYVEYYCGLDCYERWRNQSRAS
jgi:hypothetical protein